MKMGLRRLRISWLDDGCVKLGDIEMFLSTTDKLKDTGDDYAVLVDNGTEGFSVLSQHEYIESAMKARDECNYGSPMAIVKICRVADPVEI
jgi:hypothetical protein